MKIRIKVVLLLLFFILIAFAYFFIGIPAKNENIQFGVNFSQKHSQKMGLDWKANYSAILDDLGVKDIRLLTHWDLIETEKDLFDFEDLDWQIKEAEKRKAHVNPVIGMKTGRWPECHIPNWAKNLSKQVQQERILKLVEEIVNRYKDSPIILAWYVENEPLFPFGECPFRDKEFLKKEVAFVKSLDPDRNIIISDSGEASFWFTAAQIGDMVGTTLYRKVWVKELGFYVSYPIPPIFYSRKANLINLIFKKDVICTELQAEPWCPDLLYDCSLTEQNKTMDLAQFKTNIEFARKTGFDKFYLWGSEWWYWLKYNKNMPEIWQEAKILFE